MKLISTHKALLKFHPGKSNLKLAKYKNLRTFSLPAGWSCPGALTCLAKAERDTGLLQFRGEATEQECFAMRMEWQASVRDSRWHNMDLLLAAQKSGGADAMASLLIASFPRKSELVRNGVSGDLFSRAYLEAWLATARAYEKTTIYSYTKSYHLLPEKSALPSNYRVVASLGSRYPIEVARERGYSVAHIVWSEAEAYAKGFEIDHDDSHAIAADHDFALLLHGLQSKGTPAAEALRKINRVKKLRERGEWDSTILPGFGDYPDVRVSA